MNICAHFSDGLQMGEKESIFRPVNGVKKFYPYKVASVNFSDLNAPFPVTQLNILT